MHSVFLAFVIGPYLFLVSLATLVHQQRFRKIAAEILSSPPLLMFSGSLGLIFGLLIVASHNLWVLDWRLAITLIGWIVLLQGIYRLFFPIQFAKAMHECQAKIGYWLFAWIWLLVGSYLTWSAFYTEITL